MCVDLQRNKCITLKKSFFLFVDFIVSMYFNYNQHLKYGDV